MKTFHKYNIRPIITAIETDSIDQAIDTTIKNKKTKAFALSSLVGQIVAQYTVENHKHDLQMDRLAVYLQRLNTLQGK